MLVANGRLVAVTSDGVRLYACDACLDAAELRDEAAARLKRGAAAASRLK
jgi:hypothetical protein